VTKENKTIWIVLFINLLNIVKDWLRMVFCAIFLYRKMCIVFFLSYVKHIKLVLIVKRFKNIIYIYNSNVNVRKQMSIA